MFGGSFENDRLPRMVLRGALIAQAAVLLIALLLILFHLALLAFFVATLGLLLLGAVLAWLYMRYSALAIVKEKQAFTAQAAALKAKIEAQDKRIRAAQEKRTRLEQDKSTALAATLKKLQDEYIQTGLAQETIANAKIPGIGPKLKERLIASGFTSAADVNARVTGIGGFGQSKSQAVLDWRASVLATLSQSRPMQLPAEQVNAISQEFAALHARNDATEQDANGDKLKLVADLEGISPRLAQLIPYTFSGYVSRSIMPSAAPLERTKGFSVQAAIPAAAAVLVALCGVFGLASAGVSTRSAVTQPAVDYNAIRTSAFQTALASNLSTQTALLPTRSSTATSVPLTNTPLPTATDAELAGFPAAPCIPHNAPQQAMVVKVVDGDTIDVILDADGNTYPVRYIGIDTPETTGDYYAAQATAKNSELVAGKIVVLVKDVSETDRYGRLLRYVIVGDTFVNYGLVSQGYARVTSYPPDTACISTFEDAQQMAVAAGIGLWAIPTSAPVPLATSPGSSRAVCSCSGNLYNCSNFTTHASAQACYNYCISIGRGDVHRLDADSDGNACESLP